MKISHLIKEAEKNKSIKLNLSSRNLKEFPKEITSLTDLRELDLSNNELTELPPEVGKLTNLTSVKSS